MKKRPTLPKYPDGGRPAPRRQYTLDEYNALLAKYPSINPQDPKQANDVKSYVGNYITPNLKTYQSQLNTALRSKYKLDANAPITNQYLSPEEADKALNGKYNDYMSHFDAYQAYRSKTPQMPARDVEGTITEDPKVYGKRHVNLFQPYTNTAQPEFSYGGRKLPKFFTGGPMGPVEDDQNAAGYEEYNPADPNRNMPGSTPNYSQYAQVGMAGLGAYQSASNMNEGNAGDKRIAGTESGVEAGLTAATPWYGYAKQASNFGKSFVPRNEDGTAKTPVGETISRQMTPLHTQVIDSAKKGNYGMAAANALGWGNVMSAYGSIDNKTAFGKWTNKQLNEDAQYPNGGINGQPNAEVEKEEVMRMPDGQTVQVDGPSHNNGGVPVSIPTGTEIFSDRLKMPGSKKTFAKLAEKYKTDKEDKILSNDSANSVSKSTAKLITQLKQHKLDELFKAQESLKQSKVQKYAERMGVALPQSNEYPNGGRVTLGYQDPRVTGGFDMTNPSSVQDRIYPRFDGGGLFGKIEKPAPFMTPEEARQLEWENMNRRGLAAIPAEETEGPESSSMMNEYRESNPGLYSKYPVAKESAPRTSNIGEYIEPAVNTLLQNSGNIADLAMTRFGKKYDKENSGQLISQKLNPTQALIDADIQNQITRGALANVSGGNAGSYMSNAVQAGATNTLNKARIRSDYDAKNTGIANQDLYHNQAIRMQDKINEQQNKARSEDIARTAVRGIGTNTSSAYRDYKANKIDKQTLSYISKTYPDFTFDEKKGWFFNKQGKALEVK